jgi:hypothetical protein
LSPQLPQKLKDLIPKPVSDIIANLNDRNTYLVPSFLGLSPEKRLKKQADLDNELYLTAARLVIVIAILAVSSLSPLTPLGCWGISAPISVPAATLALGIKLAYIGVASIISALASASFGALAVGSIQLYAGYYLIERYNICRLGLAEAYLNTILEANFKKVKAKS